MKSVITFVILVFMTGFIFKMGWDFKKWTDNQFAKNPKPNPLIIILAVSALIITFFI